MAPGGSVKQAHPTCSNSSPHLPATDPKRHPSDLASTPKRRKIDRHSTSTPSRDLSGSMYAFGASDGAVGVAQPVPVTSPRARRISAAAPLPSHGAAAPTFGAQKLAVKISSKGSPPQDSGNDFCLHVIKELEDALSAVLLDKQPNKNIEELHRGCESVCKMQKAPDMAKMLASRCKTHVSGPIRTQLEAKVNNAPVDVLDAIVTAWKGWKAQTNRIGIMFLYLDRSYLFHFSKPSIKANSIDLFRTHVFGNTDLREKAVTGACDLLSSDRTQSSPNTSLLKDAVDMFHDLDFYTAEFEPRVLAVSQTYIASWADAECAAKSLPEYVAACDRLIAVETARCDSFDLDPSTKRGLLKLLDHHLIERQCDHLVDRDAVASLLNAEDLDGLGATYTLLQRRQMGVKLGEPFNSWIDTTGSNIIFDEKAQDKMVVRLLELKQKLDKVWRSSFQKNQTIGQGLRGAFELFINKSKKTSATWGTDNSKPGEMVAKYIDNLLRGGSKAIPAQLQSSVAKQPSLTRADKDEDENEDAMEVDEDAEVERQLDQVLDLFRFIHGKAVFEAFYKKDLARRLLMGRSASNDAEKSMLNRLNTECGSSFTHNLEQMFRDVELARDEMTGYKDRLRAAERTPDVDLNVNILSAAAWPTYPEVPCVVPAEIQRAIENFEQYYNAKHTGRKLTWKHALAHCQVRARFGKVVKEIVVSSFQAIVLLLFNTVPSGEHLSFQRIKAESGLSDAEARRTLQSLACAKLRPLTKHPKGREVEDEDTFSVNESFTHERYRVKINTIQMKETMEENKETHERVAADRQYETQAAVVRIMKARKEIAHAELIAETIKATKNRGTLQPADIKRNIDKLIDKEYMERIEGNRYAYIA